MHVPRPTVGSCHPAVAEVAEQVRIAHAVAVELLRQVAQPRALAVVT